MRNTIERLSCLLLAATFLFCVSTAASAQTAWTGYDYQSQFTTLSDGSKIHYVEAGQGDPIVLVHGIPTQGYLWRDVIPFLSDTNRVIALDLPNFGQSDKVGTISLPSYRDRFGEFVNNLGLNDVTLVVHDYGGPVALSWAAQNQERVKAVSLVETLFGPAPNVASLPPLFRTPYDLLDPVSARQGTVVDNFFVESLLLDPAFGFIGTPLSAEEEAVYRAPLATIGDREFLANLIGEVAILDTTGHPVLDPDGVGGEPALPHPNTDLFLSITDFLQNADIPKQFVIGNPGAADPLSQLPLFQSLFPDFRFDIIGDPNGLRGLHYVQEDIPGEYGTAVSSFVNSVAVPEPGSVLLLSFGSVGLLYTRFRRGKRQV